MNEKAVYVAQLVEIRRMMEKSSKFMSLSGLSGIIIGCFALIAAFIAERIIGAEYVSGTPVVWKMTALAIILLVISLAAALYLTFRRSRKLKQKMWGPGSKQLLLALLVPLVAGGTLVIILLINKKFEFIASFLLIFYGLALTSAARFSHRELFFLGLIQTTLGLMAAGLPEKGLLIWAAGFGLVHVIYGIYMYLKYEMKNRNIEG